MDSPKIHSSKLSLAVQDFHQEYQLLLDGSKFCKNWIWTKRHANYWKLYNTLGGAAPLRVRARHLPWFQSLEKQCTCVTLQLFKTVTRIQRNPKQIQMEPKLGLNRQTS